MVWEQSNGFDVTISGRNLSNPNIYYMSVAEFIALLQDPVEQVIAVRNLLVAFVRKRRAEALAAGRKVAP